MWYIKHMYETFEIARQSSRSNRSQSKFKYASCGSQMLKNYNSLGYLASQ